MENLTNNLSFEKVWLMFQETDKRFKETELRFQETDRKFQETDRKFQETDRKFQDTDRKFQETDRKFQDTEKGFKELELRFQETDRKFRDTDKMFKETELRFQETERMIHETSIELKTLAKKSDKRFKDLESLFTGQWGKLVESLVEGKLVALLRERGIDVNYTLTRLESFSRDMEIDILAQNGEEIVAVEVKTTLKNDDLKDFKGRLLRFKESFPIYKEMKIYGAVAYLKSEENVINKAIKEGYYVIRATGDSASIINSKDFKPKVW
jgi:hypothetical protein